MPLQRFFHERERSLFIASFRDEALEDLAFVVDGAPQVMHLAVDLHVHLIKVPSPLTNAAHGTDPLPSYVAREQWTEPVPPEAHCLMAKVDAAFEQQVLDIPQ